MKKIMMATIAATALCALSACTHSHYTEATGPDGGTIKHVAIAPGTSITTPAGGCINSGGGACEQLPAQQQTQ